MRREPDHLRDFRRHALFLDFDGTLADIAPAPWLTQLEPEVRETIAKLWQQFGGAVAVISGRQIEDIDSMLGLPGIPAAGIHGAQLRMADGCVTVEDAVQSEFDDIEAELRWHIGSFDGLLLERKPVSVAVHYRGNPRREDEVCTIAARIVRTRPQLKYLSGKKIIEILPHGIDKGKAIARLLQTQPFQGRIPVFAGDDITDEDGLAAVNAMGGISIKIGPGASAARFGFESGSHFRSWLKALSSGMTAEKNA
jgi:trehalose 6-phosphate phosphatase